MRGFGAFQLGSEKHVKGATPVLVLPSRSQRKLFPPSRREKRYARGLIGKSCRQTDSRHSLHSANTQSPCPLCANCDVLELCDTQMTVSIHSRHSGLIKIKEPRSQRVSRRTMEEHWQSGCDNARRTLALPQLMELPDRLEGVRTFDVCKDDYQESRSDM